MLLHLSRQGWRADLVGGRRSIGQRIKVVKIEAVKIEAVKIEGKIREVFISHLRRNAELNSAAIVFPFHPLRCDACHHAV